MTVDISGAGWRVFSGSCLDRLRELPDESVDAVVTDPPYGLSNTDPGHVSDALVRWVSGERDFIPEGKGFMGKAWDAFVPPPAVWDECLRVLKPGGHVLAFAGSRTFDLMALSIRLAGFEIRDSVAWLYGSGFPKSLDVSKAIDKAAGVEREVLTETVSDLFGEREEQKKKLDIASTHDRIAMGNGWRGEVIETIATTPEAQKWQGWGTALKPAFEPVVVARKPLVGTVAENVLLHGTGGLNIDGTRIESEPNRASGWSKSGSKESENTAMSGKNYDRGPKPDNPSGRWPSNVMLDEFTAGLVDEQSGVSKSQSGIMTITKSGGASWDRQDKGMFDAGRSSTFEGYGDTGGASRFFYVAKASKRDRNEGLDELPEVRHSDREKDDGVGGDNPRNRSNASKSNFHPTVKPTDLMRQLVRLVTPPGGVVLDPFTGSGSTGKAAILEGFEFIGVELTHEYLPIIEGRLSHAVTQRAQAESDAVIAEAETLF
jgi:site-specific DNA-methyltransferase (adenine-specific)